MENQINLADQYAAQFWQAFGARAAMDMDELRAMFVIRLFRFSVGNSFVA